MVKMRADGRVENRAVHVAIGIGMDGQTHLLHHMLGSDGLSVCCGFENGVVTRFLSPAPN
jgi:Transposase, Mutator family